MVSEEDLIYSYFNHNPDIIIVDISMPKVDGFEVLKLIKQKNKNVKYIFYFFAVANLKYLAYMKLEPKGMIVKVVKEDK